MSRDILTFIKLRGAKGQVLSRWKIFAEKCDSKLWKHCHTKCRKSCRKSATTRIVIEKIPRSGGLGFGKSLRSVWHQIDLERELARWERGDKELPSALLLSGGKEGRGRQLHHQPLLCQGVCLYNSTHILATAPASWGLRTLEVLQVLSMFLFFLLLDTLSLFNWNNGLVCV